MENPINIHDLGVPLFLETPMSFPWCPSRNQLFSHVFPRCPGFCDGQVFGGCQDRRGSTMVPLVEKNTGPKDTWMSQSPNYSPML